ncbi:MAG: FHA domain-containing protein [Bacteroides sp.]|nr:FHA domain-containing protein [Bacteroides sp.]
MNNLKGKTILIGKEPNDGRLLVAILGYKKTIAIGNPGSVPDCVSRCKPAEKTAHATITVDNNGNITLTNMKSQNITYVNGTEIASKRINESSVIELGKDRFPINIPVLLETAQDILASDGFVINHLEEVWDDLQSRRKEIHAKQKKINIVRSGCGVFTMCAMPCIFLFGPIGYVLTGIGVVGNIYSFIGLKNDNTSEVMEQLNEDFQDKYVCPNPKCNKFLGNISYKLLKKQYSMHCPYCKCEFIEK